MANSNKIIRNGVDADKAAAAVVAQLKTGTNLSQSAAGKAEKPFGQREGWTMRLISRIFRRLMPLARPVVFRYRQYMNRPILEQLSRIENRIAAQSQTSTGSMESLAVADQLGRIESYALNAARRTAVSCGKGKVLVRSAVGFVMCGVNDPALLACLLDSGELEPGTRLLIESLIRPGMTFIDAGANIGMHTLAAGRAMHGVGKIFAFEPYAPTCELLTESVFINGLSNIVEIHEAALSEKSGNQLLYLGKVSGHHSLYPQVDNASISVDPVQVRLISLEDVIPLETKIDLIKIDVEGAELEVLKSAKPFIESNAEIVIIVEFGPSHLKRTGSNTKSWFSTFSQMGLVYKEIDAMTGTLNSIAEMQLDDLESINLLFARPEANVWKQLCITK